MVNDHERAGKGVVAIPRSAPPMHARVMSDARPSTSRTFRWNDGTSTTGYAAVELSVQRGAEWYRWSHVPGEGRIEGPVQSLADLVENGPSGEPPPAVAERIVATARSLLEARR